MPANEQTWRNLKLLHVVFAVSALAMAIATLWMLAGDHLREWKKWQLTDRRKDAWVLKARHDQLAAEYAHKLNGMSDELRELDSRAIPTPLVTQFKNAVVAEDARQAASSVGDGTTSQGNGEGPEVTPVVSVSEPKKEKQFDELDEDTSMLAEQAIAVDELRKQYKDGAAEEAEPDLAALHDKEDVAIKLRREALADMDVFIREARRRENQLVGRKKSVNGIRTAAVSELGIAVGEEAPEKVKNEIQARIDSLSAQLAKLTAEIAAAKDYRLTLEGIVAEIGADQAAIAKERDSMNTELSRLDEQAYLNTTHIGEWVTRWPVLNALYNGNIRIEQNWLPDLTINYNFSQAARFDRCTTCHRAISKTAPGSATDPLYPTLPDEEREFSVNLDTPAEMPKEGQTLQEVYGLELSDTGIVRDADVTVHYALADSAAARAGLQSGDVITAINGLPPYSPAAAREQLLKLVTWGQPVKISVRRGLDHPFTAHPRLDLYLTDLSPHPQKDIGCTICHDGQGSGTSFKWTSHTPDNAEQTKDWINKYGWFDNHHWIFPMKPARFVESNCLKCHFDKGPLEPSDRFPDPPAPKLVEGWTTVEMYGCFGCHEINGFDGPDKRVGPDLRLEPPYHEAAAQLLYLGGLTAEEKALAQDLCDDPSNDEARTRLAASLRKAPGDEQAEVKKGENAAVRNSAEFSKLVSLLKDVETPGQYRKVGPSLRHVASKVDYDWLYSWIRKPSDFRPNTRMPQFFLQYEHLGDKDDAAELAESQKFEPIEIRALAEYLLGASQEFDYDSAAEGVTEKASAERGKWLFETRGCLACHSHDQFPDIKSVQGPDLSGLASKLDNDKGRKWLYTWLRDPHTYHARTKMPVLFLDPIAEKDAKGQATGKVTDAAADIVEFVLSGDSSWKPTDVPARGQFSPEESDALADLAETWLASDAIPKARASQYIRGKGFDESQREKLKTDEQLLVGLTDANRNDRLLQYVARRTIGKYGCFGCHDIPGFEDAKPIGTALADWGRKETSKLAFENIHAFMETHGLNPPNATQKVPASAADEKQKLATEEGGHEGLADTETAEHIEATELIPSEFDERDSYFVQAINSHARDGFLWQKLRYPRSYDFKTTRNKNFNERLRMPRFPFADEPEELEAVMTFVLGLVKEPPADKYVFRPEGRAKAIVEGQQVLDRFNCAGCHTLRMEQWEVDYTDDTFEDPPSVVDFPFLTPMFSDKEYAASTAKNVRGMMHASIHGQSVLDEETGKPGWVDEDRQPITKEELQEAEAEEGAAIPVFYRVTLWKDILLAGKAHLRGLEELLIPADRDKFGPANGSAYPAWGGDLANYLFPKVIAHAKESNPQVNGKEAWGWLPPPLMDEGWKVQTGWLHDFLMDPTAIRPAAVLRMPNFRMSSREATALVNYFAASSGAEFPYAYNPQQRADYLASLGERRKDPLGEAMQIVTNGNYCVKCHSVADFHPQGDPLTFGPNLADVSRRLRPEFTRNWVANPVRILPYTGMPVNIPFRLDDEQFHGGVSQELFKGTSEEQLAGLVDLLMNFDAYSRRNTSIGPQVQAAAEAAAAAAKANQPAGDDAAEPAEKTDQTK